MKARPKIEEVLSHLHDSLGEAWIGRAGGSVSRQLGMADIQHHLAQANPGDDLENWNFWCAAGRAWIKQVEKDIERMEAAMEPPPTPRGRPSKTMTDEEDQAIRDEYNEHIATGMKPTTAREIVAGLHNMHPKTLGKIIKK